MFIIFLVLLILGVPIAFSLGFSSLFYLFANGIPLTVIAQKFYAGMDSFTLLCIPGFMLAGALMNGGGITKRILNFCNSFLGHFRGSLALVNIVASMVFAGISGTAIADVCSLGSMLIPAMVEDGSVKESRGQPINGALNQAVINDNFRKSRLLNDN